MFIWKVKSQIINKLLTIRRNFLTFITPEFFWPKTVVIDDVRIKVRGEPYSFGIKLVLKRGEYEGLERKLLKSYDLTGETIIEMGGSIGILTAVLSKKVGNKGHVISVEASKKISSYSRFWLEKDQNTKVVTGFGFPVSNTAGIVDIVNFDESGNTLQGKLIYNLNPKREIHNNLIFDIQKIVNLFKIQPTILVADIEGSEKIITDIRPDFPSTIKIILIELHPFLYGKNISDQIINRIIKEGFFIQVSEGNVYLFERSG